MTFPWPLLSLKSSVLHQSCNFGYFKQLLLWGRFAEFSGGQPAGSLSHCLKATVGMVTSLIMRPWFLPKSFTLLISLLTLTVLNCLQHGLLAEESSFLVLHTCLEQGQGQRFHWEAPVLWKTTIGYNDSDFAHYRHRPWERLDLSKSRWLKSAHSSAFH
jgi:hypothetical protein